MPRLALRVAATLAVLTLLPAAGPASAEGIRHLRIGPALYADAREALVDAIEAEGLVPSPPSQFGDMLARTAPALGETTPVYQQAEVMHFCSALIAWQLARENPVNIAQCPLSMAIYTRPGQSAAVHLAWREAHGDSQGARAANALLERIARQVADNAGRAAMSR